MYGITTSSFQGEKKEKNCICKHKVKGKGMGEERQWESVLAIETEALSHSNQGMIIFEALVSS